MILISDKDCKDTNVVKRPYLDEPMDIVDPFNEKNKDRFSLSAHFVNITCSKYNQDVSAVCSGSKGRGKSYSTVSLAYDCAKRTAIALDNDVNKWKDYFDVERNMAVMDSDKLIDILTSKEKHQVIISDDAGTIQGARKFMSEENQLINSVLVVNRTLNNIYFSSAPESKHIDRQARDLPEHQIDFEKNPAGMTKGFATCKYFEKIINPKTSESYYQYPYWNNMKVVRCYIEKPPKELSDEYDRLRIIGRDKQQARLKEMKEKRLQEERDKEEGKEQFNEKGNNFSHRENRKNSARDTAAEKQKIVDEYRLMGMTLKEALREAKIPVGTWKSWKYQGYVS